MTDPPKKSPHLADINKITNILKSCQVSNDRNHRLQIEQSSHEKKEPKMNYSRQEKFNSNENNKSTPKPLLECLQAAPLLTSKPYEKSMSQRRRKNKPFDETNLGRFILSLN